MDSKDGRDLKLKKLGQLFQVLMVRLQKITEQIIMVRAPRRHFFDVFHNSQESVYVLPAPSFWNHFCFTPYY